MPVQVAPVFREAGEQDLVALASLEREANEAALGHVFPPDRYPFPENAVLARWRLVLDDPEVAVLAVNAQRGGDLVAYVAHDDSTLRHLAVHPDHWGEGFATAAIQIALRGMGSRGSTEVSLWCLQENHRARRLYEHLGWKPTDDIREAPWPPHPLETRHTRLVAHPET